MTPSELIKKKQKKLFACCIVGAAVMVIVTVWLDSGVKKENKPEMAKLHNFADDISDHNSWYWGESAKISAVQQQMHDLTAGLQTKDEVIEKLSETLQQSHSEHKELENKILALEQQVNLHSSCSGLQEGYAPFESKAQTNTRSFSEVEAYEDNPSPTYHPPRVENYANSLEGQLAQPSVVVHHFENKANNTSKKNKNINQAIPSNSFIQAILLNGVDISASQTSQANPKPVMMNITGWGNLPNSHKIKTLKQCRIHATAWGDLSSERVYMQPDLLTCVDKNGDVVETSVWGYVSSKGKTGIRGKMIKRDVELIQQAAIAGAISGLGHSLSNTQGTTSISPLGSTKTLNRSEAFQADVGKGVGNALDKIADYKIKQAESLQPIIQIDGGIEVDVMFYKSSYLGVVEAPAPDKAIKSVANANSEIFKTLTNINSAIGEPSP